MAKDIFTETGFDELDRAILKELQKNARITNADLARKIHLSQPAVHNRIKKLEKRGVIQQYTAQIQREALGYDLLCIIQLRTDGVPEHIQAIQTALAPLPQILECHHLTGDYDIFIKAVIRSHQQIQPFIQAHIAPLSGIQQVQTNIVLSEFKHTGDVPLSGE